MKRPRERTQPFSKRAPSLTGVSHLWQKKPEKYAMRSLARVSLLLALTMNVAGSGCMVTSSPDFTEPKMTRPFLSAVSPVAWAVKTVTSVAPGTFVTDSVTFAVVSEDLNQTLKAALLLDYQGPVAAMSEMPAFFPPVLIIDPGHIDAPSLATPRQAKIPFRIQPGTQVGCHTLTVVATHDLIEGTRNPRHDEDTGTLTWWLNVQDPLGGQTSPQSLASCFAGSTPTGDAGNTATGDAGALGASP